ncbi:hypothetical protein D3C87_1614210 [compost metagenome]
MQRPTRIGGGFNHEVDGLFAVFGDEYADAGLADQPAAQAHRRDRFADDRAADVEFVAQRVFRRQLVAGAIGAGIQALVQFLDDHVCQARTLAGPGGSFHRLSYRG